MYFRPSLWLLFCLVLWSYFFFIDVDGKRQRSRGPGRISVRVRHSRRSGGYYRPGSSCKPRRNCRLSKWCAWSQCSATCGPNGVKTRTRHIIENARCGGRCGALQQVRRCNRRCLNGGYMRYGKCKCRKGYSGCCCEGGKLVGSVVLICLLKLLPSLARAYKTFRSISAYQRSTLLMSLRDLLILRLD